LKDIIGQDKAIGVLKGILQRNRLAGSYLFCGEAGIGKKTAAVNFAKAVNCLNAEGISGRMDENLSLITDRSSPVVAVDSCDACESCLKIASGSHPDVLSIAPEERQIRIEEIRSIEEALSFRPFEGRKKVVIVDDADTMNQAAANAFLKTLEEPPEDSLIILIASRPDRLPSTIRSRCSRIAFQTLSLDSCRRILEGKVATEEMEQAVRLSLGRPGRAVSSDMREERDWFINLLKAMLRAEKDCWASREEVEKWFDLALPFMRDLAVLKITGRQALLINADLAENLGKLGKSLEVQGIIDIYRELSFIKTMLLFNLNKSLTWNYTASLLRKELVS
jgi:DNA polymerase-3 subunit delta'